MPIFALIAYYAIDKWAREKVVNGVEVSIAFLAHISFLVGKTQNIHKKSLNTLTLTNHSLIQIIIFIISSF